jgi:phosphomannomutase
MSLMVSISGIRGIVGDSLTPDVVVKYAAAYAEYCNRGTIILGRDGRVTGKSVAHLVSSTLIEMGCNVKAIGVCPTPTVALAVEKLKAAGGISITASHNPNEWNGLKFFAPSGMFLDSDENKRFWEIAQRGSFAFRAWDKQGTHAAIPEFLEKHLALTLKLPWVKPALIRKRKLKVVVDCVNGSGGVIVPKLLRKLGCNVIELNCDASGIFAHTPEPIPENLTQLSKKVKSSLADLGIAIDPDADRIVLIDERGIPVGEEYSIASTVKFVLSKLPRTKSKSVVVNLSTTRAVDEIARQYGASVFRTAVGEINVAKKMREIGAIIGGEGSGGIILPKVHLGRDAIVGTALVVQQLAEFDGSMSQLKATLPHFEIVKGKVQVGNLNANSVLLRLQKNFQTKGVLNYEDGLKIDFPNSWVHLRKSNTEPILRIIAEAPTKEEASALVKQFAIEIQKVE